MSTLTKLFLMTHNIPVRISTNDSIIFYKAVAKLHGLRVEHRLYGFVLS